MYVYNKIYVITAENKDYYQILGVDKNVSQDDIKKAYKKMCMKWHPDRWVNASEQEEKDAEEHFKDVNEANSVLSDENKRRNYDTFGTTDDGYRVKDLNKVIMSFETFKYCIPYNEKTFKLVGTSDFVNK